MQSVIVDWFSRWFIAPADYQLISGCQSNAIYVFLDDLGDTLALNNLSTLIIELFRNHAADEVERLLHQQYVALFDGMSGPKAVPPYESYYFDPHGRLCQTPYIDLLNIMSELDVSVIADCKEPADHLALQLAAFAEALRQQNAMHIEGLHKRLLNWVPHMHTAVQQSANTTFYARLLELLVSYLSSFNAPDFTGNQSITR